MEGGLGGHATGLGPLRWGLVSEPPSTVAPKRFARLKVESVVPDHAVPPVCAIDKAGRSTMADEGVNSGNTNAAAGDPGPVAAALQKHLPLQYKLQNAPAPSNHTAAVAAVAQEESRQGLQLQEAQKAGIWAFNHHQSLVLPQQEERQQQWLRQEGGDGVEGALDVVARIEAASRVASVAAAAATAAATAAVFASGSRIQSVPPQSMPVESSAKAAHGYIEAKSNGESGTVPAFERGSESGTGLPLVWVVNPSVEKKTAPFPVEQWRVVKRQFEEEALTELMQARGAEL